LKGEWSKEKGVDGKQEGGGGYGYTLLSLSSCEARQNLLDV
jgi:hypothetical protein